MGTRSLTVFHYNNEDDEEIVVLYRQMDGYPDGHGKDLAEFLAGKIMVNGIGMGDESKMCNGMECLAAQVVAHFKDGVGGFYLMAAGTRDVWEDFIYHVRGKVGEEPTIEIQGICKGPASEVLARITAKEFEDA